MKGYTHGNRGCEIQMVEDKAIWIGVEDKDVRLGLHHLGAGAGVQQEPDDPEPARGSGLTKDQARLRTGHNQHLQRKLQELLFWLRKPEIARVGSCWTAQQKSGTALAIVTFVIATGRLLSWGFCC